MSEKKCSCGPDCTCGCNEGKECTCENCNCECCYDCCCDSDCECVCVGEDVPNFKMTTWSPAKSYFDSVCLDEIMASGKWTVLVFFPAAFSPVCPTELAELAEYQEEFKKLNAELITVSTDTQFSLMAWQQSDKLLKDVQFQMASDANNEVSSLFGIYDAETGLALRGTFIISPKGKLLSSEVSFYNVARSATELLRKLQANIYVSQHPEMVCPAKWKPGQKGLAPSGN